MNPDLAWFISVSHIKNKDGKFCAGHMLPAPFKITEAVPLPSAASAQQAESYRGTSLCFADLFYKLKVCDNPVSSKSVGTIFPAALALLVYLPHLSNPCNTVKFVMVIGDL